MNLRARYQDRTRTVVTAHRGFSARYPENTLLAFRQAVDIGADIVEFDVRESADGELVIMHDARLERTTTGTGAVADRTLAELKRLNATCWSGPHDTGRRLERPLGDETIPTLAEALDLLAGRVGLNIQVYTDSPGALDRIIRLYRDYDLRESGFLMLRSFAEGERVRAACRDVALCEGEARDDLERHLAFGVDYIQPTRPCLTPGYVRRLLASGLPANVFYANDPEDMNGLIEQGLPGIMTDAPDRLIDRIRIMKETALKRSLA
jgi:glycerophosphoryl diester phosphodiesterase